MRREATQVEDLPFALLVSLHQIIGAVAGTKAVSKVIRRLLQSRLPHRHTRFVLYTMPRTARMKGYARYANRTEYQSGRDDTYDLDRFRLTQRPTNHRDTYHERQRHPADAGTRNKDDAKQRKAEQDEEELAERFVKEHQAGH